MVKWRNSDQNVFIDQSHLTLELLCLADPGVCRLLSSKKPRSFPFAETIQNRSYSRGRIESRRVRHGNIGLRINTHSQDK